MDSWTPGVKSDPDELFDWLSTALKLQLVHHVSLLEAFCGLLLAVPSGYQAVCSVWNILISDAKPARMLAGSLPQ